MELRGAEDSSADAAASHSLKYLLMIHDDRQLVRGRETCFLVQSQGHVLLQLRTPGSVLTTDDSSGICSLPP